MGHAPLNIVLLATAILGTLGCRCETRIVGGSPESRRAAWEAAELFFGALDPELDVCVPRIAVRVKGLPQDRSGQYFGPTGHVALRDSLRPAQAFHTTLHELCHALDRQNPERVALEGRPELWTLPKRSRPEVEGEERMHESFAHTCERGPVAARILATSCPGDADGVEAFEVVADFFTAPLEGVALQPYRWEEVASFRHGLKRTTGLELVPLAGGALAMEVRGRAARPVGAIVDLHTGEPAPLTAPILSEEGPPARLPGLSREDGSRGGGTELFMVTSAAGNGARGRRLLLREGASEEHDGVVVHSACPRKLERPFVVDGAPWSAWVDGATVRWGRWVRDDV